MDGMGVVVILPFPSPLSSQAQGPGSKTPVFGLRAGVWTFALKIWVMKKKAQMVV